MVEVHVDVEVDLEYEVQRLGKADLEILREAIDENLAEKSLDLFGSKSRQQSLPPVSGETAWDILQHLRKGRFVNARWELERAFNPPLSPEFRAKHFVKEAALTKVHEVAS